ncbi:unnamed protein product, partial [Symbiodinium pilosum]
SVSGLGDDAYAWQFHAAAGSHTGARGNESLKVYSSEERNKLYDGLAGRPRVEAAPRPYDTPRRRFPGANVSQVDGLLRDDRTPLASEHPSQYGELYTGAAGVHGHWLLKPKVEDVQKCPGGTAGAGPSQVDEIVLGRDLDGSSGTALKQLLLEGAAGCKSIGVAPKFAGKRCVPGGDSQVDELIWGTDVDGSSDPALQKAKDQLFQGAAGSKGPPQLQGGRRHLEAESGRTPRPEGRRHHAGPADRVAWLLGKPGAVDSP